MAALDSDEGTAPGESRDRATLLKFFLPSTLGVLLFLAPINVDGTTKVLLGVIADWINASAGMHMRTFCAFVFVTSAVLTPLYSFGPETLRRRLPGLKTVFQAGPVTTLMRVAGGVFCGLTIAGIGPKWIIGPDTGGTAYFSIAAIIFCLIGTGAMLMPLLTDYGLLEFVGTILRRFFQRVFGLPGRSTIDALASWVGSSSIAVIVTSRQYEGGYYTAREASVIATNFSVVSVPFVFLTASVAGIPELGGTLYGAMVLVGVICALITPRLPPLSRMPDEYYAPVGKQLHEQMAEGVSTGTGHRFSGSIRAGIDCGRHHVAGDQLCARGPVRYAADFHGGDRGADPSLQDTAADPLSRRDLRDPHGDRAADPRGYCALARSLATHGSSPNISRTKRQSPCNTI